MWKKEGGKWRKPYSASGATCSLETLGEEAAEPGCCRQGRKEMPLAILGSRPPTPSQPQNELSRGKGPRQTQLSLPQDPMVPSQWGGQLLILVPGATFYWTKSMKPKNLTNQTRWGLHNKLVGHRARVDRSSSGVPRMQGHCEVRGLLSLEEELVPKDSPPPPTPVPPWGGIRSESWRVGSRAGLVVGLAFAASANGYKKSQKSQLRLQTEQCKLPCF